MVKVILLSQNRIVGESSGNWKIEENIVEVKRLFQPTLRFTVNPDDLFYKGRKPTFFIDLNARKSIKPNLKEEPNLEIANRLDFLNERAFWSALLSKQKIPLGTVIIYLLAGMGFLYFIRIILYSFGVYVP